MGACRGGGVTGARRRWWAYPLVGVVFIFCMRFLLLRSPQANNVSRRAAIIRQQIRVNPIRNNHTFAVLHEPDSGCSKDTKLLVLVASSFDNWGRRQAIRDTWGGGDRLRNLSTRLLFLLGKKDDAPQDMVDAEAAEYGDLLQQTFHDSYGNLTLKTMMGLKWASQQCDSVDFVAKTDDDIYWNLSLLRSHLETIDNDRIITGCIKQFSAPAPINFQGMPAPPGHPLFTTGAGYVFSGALSGDLYEASLRVRLLPIEDVFITGYCAKMAHAWPPKHHEGFSCGDVLTDDCDLVQQFNAHKVTPERQYLIWDKFTSDPNPCMDF